MDEVEIDFADASTQIFHVGEASVAVPGLLLGLEEAHERRGRLAWARLFVPALELAARPFATTAAQAFLHEILVPILQREDGGQADLRHGRASSTQPTSSPTLRLLQDVRARRRRDPAPAARRGHRGVPASRSVSPSKAASPERRS